MTEENVVSQDWSMGHPALRIERFDGEGPVLDNLVLSAGKHMTPREGVCIMEILSLALVGSKGTVWTDMPICTDAGIARAAQAVWDSVSSPTVRLVVPDEAIEITSHNPRHLDLIAHFLPRLLRARRPAKHRTRVRIALAAVRYLYEQPTHFRLTINDIVIKAVEAWLAGDPRPIRDVCFQCGWYPNQFLESGEDTPERWLALACDSSTEAEFEEERVLQEVARRIGPFLTNTVPRANYLDAMLDAHEKAMAEEGEMVTEREDWEDEAVEFVDRLMAEVEDARAEAALRDAGKAVGPPPWLDDIARLP